jgi:2-keto-3-deoxy-galactonokinase
VQHTRQTVIGVIRGEEPSLMSLGRQLLGESFNMTTHTTWIRVRVGRYQRYTHSEMVAATLYGRE